jgi:nitrogen-specific signal transduction histidine kinase
MTNGIPHKPLLSPETLRPDLYGDFSSIQDLEFVQEVLNSSPLISALVNNQRQVILSNFHLHDVAGLKSIEEFLGKRPGEILSCMHKDENKGCGTTSNCQFCGILQTVKQSQIKNKTITNECRLTTKINSHHAFHDFQVTCSPVFFNHVMYTLMYITDISTEKRNTVLENVFFHDIMNRLGGLSGIIQVIKAENQQKDLHEYIDMLETISEMVIEEIQSQRQLKSAENNELILDIQHHSSKDIIDAVRKMISFHSVMNSLELLIDPDSKDFKFNTDSTLLKRILLNMTKNAAEATPANGIIKIGCTIKSGNALFSVNNPGIIPNEIQLQIFQRSYSTKGRGRGLGTYSMKLFGENYLKGKVYFASDEIYGTTFSIELPLG